jgi:DNA polymerase III sliding clamp (beta) subunit (PCNA family)
MRVAVDTQEMKKILGRLSTLLDGKSELESFRTLRIDVVNGKLRFSSTTSSMYASDIYEQDEKRRSTIEPFGVNGKEFYEVIKILGVSEGECTLVIDKTCLTIEKGRSKLRLTKYSEDMLLPFKGDWPDGGEAAFNELDIPGFCQSIKKVLFVPDADPERDLHTASIHINAADIVTTNRKVLAVKKNQVLSCPDVPFHMVGTTAEKLVKVLSMLEGECRYHLDGHFLYIMCGSFRARISGAVMAYPAYRSVVLAHVKNFSFYVSKKELITALKTAGIAATRTKGLKKVSLSFEKDGLHVDCDAGESSSSAVVALNLLGTSPAKSVFDVLSRMNPFSFDLELLLQGVGSISDDSVIVTIDSNSRPMVFSEEDYDFYIGMLRS